MLRRIIERSQPDEIYNLGAQSHVRVSFDQSEYLLYSESQVRIRYCCQVKI